MEWGVIPLSIFLLLIFNPALADCWGEGGSCKSCYTLTTTSYITGDGASCNAACPTATCYNNNVLCTSQGESCYVISGAQAQCGCTTNTICGGICTGTLDCTTYACTTLANSGLCDTSPACYESWGGFLGLTCYGCVNEGAYSCGSCTSSSCCSDAGGYHGCSWTNYWNRVKTNVQGTCPTTCYTTATACTWYNGDTSSTICGYVGGSWGIGGEVDGTVCCGNDASEFRVVENTYSRAIAFDNDEDACCNIASDCISGSTCYVGYSTVVTSGQNTGLNAGGNDNKAYCYSGDGIGKWLDCDQDGYMNTWCSNSGGTICGKPYANGPSGDNSVCQTSQGGTVSGEPGAFGEYTSSGQCGCCGDDANENYRTSSGTVGTDGTNACCNSNTDCVYGSTCYDSGTYRASYYCNAGAWNQCGVNSDCGAGYYCNGGTCSSCTGSQCSISNCWGYANCCNTASHCDNNEYCLGSSCAICPTDTCGVSGDERVNGGTDCTALQWADFDVNNHCTLSCSNLDNSQAWCTQCLGASKWFTGSITGTDYPCCGDDGSSDDFTNGTKTCINGVAYSGNPDNNQTICVDSGLAWLDDTSGASTTFVAHIIPNASSISDSIAVDFDKDGEIDIVARIPTEIYWLDNNNGAFIKTTLLAGSYLNKIRVIDADADGDYDIYYFNGNGGHLDLLRNDGGGVFTNNLIYSPPTDSTIYNWDVADAENDGDADIAVVIYPLFGYGETNYVLFLRNDGGGYAQITVKNPWASAYDVKFGDVNNDGNKDIVGVAQSDFGEWGLLAFLYSGGSYPTTKYIDTSGPFRYIYLVDFNKDGYLDIITDYGDSGIAIVIHYGTGGGNFNWGGSLYNQNTDYAILAGNDLNNDGTIDLVSGTGGLLWFKNSGGLTKYDISGDSSGQASVVDFDLDSDLDVISRDKWYENELFKGQTPRCCGNTGTSDNFYSGLIGNSNKFCYYGTYANQLIDNNNTLCSFFNYTWIINAPVNGLISHWGLNEGTGTITGDDAGSNPGTITSATWTTNGKFGNALSFNGVNQYVSLGIPLSLGTSGSFTFTAWVNVLGSGNFYDDAIFGEGGHGWVKGCSLYGNVGTGSLNQYFYPVFGCQGATGQDFSTSSPINVLNQGWQFLTGVLDRSTPGSEKIYIYVNGILAGSLTTPPAWINGYDLTNTNGYFIGRSPGYPSSKLFNGMIDDVRIYNHALSATEVMNLYTSNSSIMSCCGDDKLAEDFSNSSVYCYQGNLTTEGDTSASVCAWTHNNWLYGSTTGSNKSCCGDDGLNDVFYNGSIGTTTSFCQYGQVINQAIDSNATICNYYNDTFISNGVFINPFHFDDATPGNEPPGWDIIKTFETSFNIASSIDGQSLVLDMYDNNDTNTVGDTRIGRGFSGTETGYFKFKFRLDDINKQLNINGREPFCIWYGGLYCFDQPAMELVIDDGTIYNRIGETLTPLQTGLASNTWYTAKVTFNTCSLSYDLSINDVPVSVTNIPMPDPGIPCGYRGITYIRFWTGTADMNYHAYIDDIDFSWTNIDFTDCCGDDGSSDTFYNGTLSSSNNFCYQGSYYNNTIDTNQTICQNYGYLWLNNGVGVNASCCGDDGLLDTFYNGTLSTTKYFCQNGTLINQELDVNNTLCNQYGHPWVINSIAGSDALSYKKLILLNNPGTALIDYQVNFTIDTASLISLGDMQTDCDDIRFYNSTGSLIPYWVESGCNTASTKVWVKVPRIPASGNETIWMHFGNNGVSSLSNISSVMDFYDDFESLTDFEVCASTQVRNGWTFYTDTCDQILPWYPIRAGSSVRLGDRTIFAKAGVNNGQHKASISTSVTTIPGINYLLEYNYDAEEIYSDYGHSNSATVKLYNGTTIIDALYTENTTTSIVKATNTFVPSNAITLIKWESWGDYNGGRTKFYLHNMTVRKYASVTPTITIDSSINSVNNGCCGDDGGSDMFYNNTIACYQGALTTNADLWQDFCKIDPTREWFNGAIQGNSEYSPCCGDDGLLDTFYNGSISTTNYFCQNGTYINQEIDQNNTVCNNYYNNKWVDGEILGNSTIQGCCGDDGTSDVFYNRTLGCYQGALTTNADLWQDFCKADPAREWLTGSINIVGGSNYGPCCGDDGLVENFYNATNGYGGYCVNGSYFYGDSDTSSGICEFVSGTWLSGANGDYSKCCGDDNGLDDFGNNTNVCCCNGVVVASGTYCDLGQDGNLDSQCVDGNLPSVYVTQSTFTNAYVTEDYNPSFLLRNTGNDTICVISATLTNTTLNYNPSPSNPSCITPGNSGLFAFSFEAFTCNDMDKELNPVMNITYNTTNGETESIVRYLTVRVRSPLDITSVTPSVSNTLAVPVNEFDTILVTLKNEGETGIDYNVTTEIDPGLILLFNVQGKTFTSEQISTEEFNMQPKSTKIYSIKVVPSSDGLKTARVTFNNKNGCSNITDFISFQVNGFSKTTQGTYVVNAWDDIMTILLLAIACLVIYKKQ